MTDEPTPFIEWPRLVRRVVVFITPIGPTGTPLPDEIRSFVGVTSVSVDPLDQPHIHLLTGDRR